MKKIAICLLGVLFLSGCSGAPSSQFSIDSYNVDGNGLLLLTDKLTGCQYLDTLHGLTPRLTSSGLPFCNGTKAKEVK